jgi:hypothetical protein
MREKPPGHRVGGRVVKSLRILPRVPRASHARKIPGFREFVIGGKSLSFREILRLGRPWFWSACCKNPTRPLHMPMADNSQSTRSGQCTHRAIWKLSLSAVRSDPISCRVRRSRLH